MERVRSNEISAHVGARIVVRGWVQAIRRLGAVSFLVVRDGWGIVQAVVVDEAKLAGIVAESVVEVTGTVVAEPQHELHGVDVRVLSAVDEPPTIQLGKKKL